MNAHFYAVGFMMGKILFQSWDVAHNNAHRRALGNREFLQINDIKIKFIFDYPQT